MNTVSNGNWINGEITELSDAEASWKALHMLYDEIVNGEGASYIDRDSIKKSIAEILGIINDE